MLKAFDIINTDKNNWLRDLTVIVITSQYWCDRDGYVTWRSQSMKKRPTFGDVFQCSENIIPRTVELSEPNPVWNELYSKAASEIKEILKDNLIEIHHIGSTAIPNIYAKPIIDILPVVKDISQIDVLNSQFEALGYVCMGEYGMPNRRFFWRSKSKRTHNVHIFQENSPEVLRHLAFKNYLIAHPKEAKAYSIIKRCLAVVFANDIQDYVEGKDSFIQMIDYKTGHVRAAQLAAKDDIVIVPYQDAWPKLADVEMNAIKLMADNIEFTFIEHIGSTAVPGLASKPIIDILITVPSIARAHRWISLLETLGYVFWSENPDKNHMRFFKGMPPFGVKRTHHIHIVETTNTTVEQRILFRDILRRDKKIKDEYALLKINLSKLYLTDRESYTDMKSEFIESVLRLYGYRKPILK